MLFPYLICWTSPKGSAFYMAQIPTLYPKPCLIYSLPDLRNQLLSILVNISFIGLWGMLLFLLLTILIDQSRTTDLVLEGIHRLHKSDPLIKGKEACRFERGSLSTACIDFKMVEYLKKALLALKIILIIMYTSN